MSSESTDKTQTTCKECKYIFIGAFLVLIGFFVLNYIFRGPALTTNLPQSVDTTFSSTTAQ